MARDTSSVTDRGDAGPHGLPGGLNHPEILRPGFADHETAGRVTVPAIQHGAEVDGDEIAVTDHPVPRDAVNQFVVHGDARHPRKRGAVLGAVAQEVRGRPVLGQHVPAHRVDLGGGDALRGGLLHPAQTLGHDQSRGSHFPQLFGCLDLYRHLRPCVQPPPRASAAVPPRRCRCLRSPRATPAARSGTAAARSGRRRPPCDV